MDERKESVIIFGKRCSSIYDSPCLLSTSSSSKKRKYNYDENGFILPLSPQTSPMHKSNSSPKCVDDLLENNYSTPSKYNNRRGRPKLDTITNLINTGTASPSPIRCYVCNRVFPREKSLQAHLRTHTGERPYLCDFPGCGRRFTQSGQLRTHQRLHTGEQPFICGYSSCTNRFTHANRHCPTHPKYGVKRDKGCSVDNNGEVVKITTRLENASQAVIDWLDKYKNSVNNPQKEIPIKKHHRLRERNFNQELDDVVATSSATNITMINNDHKDYTLNINSEHFENKVTEDETNLSESDRSSPTWSREIMSLYDHDYDNSDNIITKDKLMGALALMELASSSMVTSVPNIGSEIDINTSDNYIDSMAKFSSSSSDR